VLPERCSLIRPIGSEQSHARIPNQRSLETRPQDFQIFVATTSKSSRVLQLYADTDGKTYCSLGRATVWSSSDR
jgi:hypothetical protein